MSAQRGAPAQSRRPYLDGVPPGTGCRNRPLIQFYRYALSAPSVCPPVTIGLLHSCARSTFVRGQAVLRALSLTLRAEPAIDIQDCTGHVRGGGTRQEGDPGGDFLWSCKAAQCNAFDQTAQLCLERLDHIGIRESR